MPPMPCAPSHQPLTSSTTSRLPTGTGGKFAVPSVLLFTMGTCTVVDHGICASAGRTSTGASAVLATVTDPVTAGMPAIDTAGRLATFTVAPAARETGGTLATSTVHCPDWVAPTDHSPCWL